jgi:hypothetical protein
MKRWIVQLLVLPFLFNMGAPAYAATTDVTLAWDANTEPDIAGYKLYQSNVTGGPYALAQTVGIVTTTVVAGVADGRTCWVLTAYRATPLTESGYSNEVCYFFNTTPPSVPRNLAATSLVRVP